MSIVTLLIPSIFALVILTISLKFEKSKQAAIVAVTFAMVAFLFFTNKLNIITVLNISILIFSIVYLMLTAYLSTRKNS